MGVNGSTKINAHWTAGLYGVILGAAWVLGLTGPWGCQEWRLDTKNISDFMGQQKLFWVFEDTHT